MGRGVRINPTWACVFSAALALTACGRSQRNPHGGRPAAGGAAGIAGDESGDEGGVGGTVATDQCEPDAALAPARVLLLTDSQFQNAVHDLFGVDVTLSLAAPENLEGPLAPEEATVMTREQALRYHVAAKQVAQAIKPCGDAAVDATCMLHFLREKMPRAWRRPISVDEATSVVRLFEAGKPLGTEAAVEVVVSALLESGSFLYRTELGKADAAPGAQVTLTPFELATAIGFAYLDSIPDDSLWAKAVDGSLASPEVLAAEADRLLELPAVRDNLRRKVSSYLGLEALRSSYATKDPLVFPGYSEGVRDGLYAGAQDLLDELVWHGRFNDLFSSSRLYANQDVAAFYGIPGVQGDALVAVDFEADRRQAGILSHPAWLAANSHRATGDDISHRGVSVLEAFTCTLVPRKPPPHPSQGQDTILGPGSIQQQWRDLDSQAVCAGCHQLFDPFGFALEGYDAVGRYRTLDETGAPIDTSATVRQAGTDLDGDVNDINDVAAKLAGGRRASDCGALRLTSLTLDRSREPAPAPCAMHAIQDALESKGSFTALFKAIVTSPAFLIREEAQ
jgi:Protein of unknown function (DUF1592)/Protein of unknown function (DUF1588)/Protein of unknown function (DUF1595)/Protein of unknown function (DUF1587)